MMELSLAKFSEPKSSSKTFHTNSNEKNTSVKCSLCSKAHYVSRCYTFLKFSNKSKMDFVTKNKLCKNCFSKHHTDSNCTSKRNCNSCSQRHHTLIHNHFSTRSPPNENSEQSSSSEQHEESGQSSNTPINTTRTYHIGAIKNQITLLGTAQLKIFNSQCHHITLRSLDVRRWIILS